MRILEQIKVTAGRGGVAMVACLVVAAATGCQGGDASSRQGTSQAASVAGDAAKPGLRVGDRAPDAGVMSSRGESMQLATVFGDGPVVITFYRGGWCPYCTKALAGWREHIDELEAMGGRLIAITPEKPEIALATLEEEDLGTMVVSDADHAAAKAYRVHFGLDDATVSKYRGFGIDLGSTNASGTWELPAPATFVIDRRGVVRWVFADWDYRKRAEPRDVLAAVAATENGR